MAERKSTARSSSKSDTERAPLPGPLAQAAYQEAWQAWASLPAGTRGEQPRAPIAGTVENLLLDIAISLRQMTGDDVSDEDAAKAYKSQADELGKQQAKVDSAEAKATQAVADAEAELAAARDQAAEDVAKAKGEKLGTSA